VPRIVVGVDASEDSKAALSWAAAEARLRGATLQAVYAFHGRERNAPEYVPTERGLAGSAVNPSIDSYQEVRVGRPDQSANRSERGQWEDLARSRAEEMLSSALYPLREALAGVQVERVVVDDKHPAEALVELSADADLLVVGSRGRGGFSRMLLGSISHAAVLHAECPVVVVPADRG
jgi:nucleotide-binding universal stress UspA family protein